MIEDLKKNIEQEKAIIDRIESLNLKILQVDENEKKIYKDFMKGLSMQLKTLNNAVPSLLESISPAKQLSVEIKKPAGISKVSYISPETNEKKVFSINKKDKENFAKGLSLAESGVRRIKKENIIAQKPSYIASLSNRFFSGTSEKISSNFHGLKDDIKKANIRFTLITYLSIAIFVSVLVFIISLLVLIVLSIIQISYIMWIWVPFALAVICLTAFYVYPSSEKGSVEKRISEELPFATIYMAAIAGADIEPTKIFKIIAISNEYPNIGYEIKKMVNQVEIYGYDFVTSLKNSAKSTSNKKLAELFSGLATNIVSGGNLKDYLEKKSENLLLDYRLERQSYSSVAETFMDVYISILVAAPMVLMMLVVIMNLTNLGGGFSIITIMILAIGGVVLVNIIFLIILQIKQPGV